MAIFLVYLAMPVIGFLCGIVAVQFLVSQNPSSVVAEFAKVFSASFGAFAISGVLGWLFMTFAEKVPEPVGWSLIAGFALALALVGAGASILIFGVIRLI